MSALGHYLEEEGIATVAISLIRPQTENTKPPRALWVPFELGRPFGPPSDPAFQKRVILAALRLLERNDGPVLIEDFPDDDPRAAPGPGLAAAASAEPRSRDGAAEIAGARLEAEIAAAAGRACALDRRSTAARTVGLSGLSIADAAVMSPTGCAARRRRARATAISAPLMLRFAVDDLKAYYLEAAAAGPAQTVEPTARRLVLERDRGRRGDPCAARDVPGTATTSG